MQAHVDGAEIESHTLNPDNAWKWKKNTAPMWDWVYTTYRIKPQPTGSEQVIELLKQGKPVLCGVSDASQSDADKSCILLRVIRNSANGGFRVTSDTVWKFASPVDLSQFAQPVK